MVKSRGTGNLFPEDAKQTFMRLTGQRYDAMKDRMVRKKLPPLPFTKQEFRDHILLALGKNYDGFSRCRYCLGFFGIKDVAADHAIPLSRGGSLGLENLEYPCHPCNSRKGAMTPTEYLALLEFLNTKVPLARIEVLKRLEQSVKLAAGVASTRGVVGELRKSGQWGAAQAAIRARKGKR